MLQSSPPVAAPQPLQSAAHSQAHSTVPLMSARAAEALLTFFLSVRCRAHRPLALQRQNPHLPSGALLRRWAFPPLPACQVHREAGSGHLRCAAAQQHARAGSPGQALEGLPPLQSAYLPHTHRRLPLPPAAAEGPPSPWDVPPLAACALAVALLRAWPAALLLHVPAWHLAYDAYKNGQNPYHSGIVQAES